MPFSTKELFDKINTMLAAGNLSAAELAQLSTIKKSVENMSAISVATLSLLPDATQNSGRFIYVNDIRDYRYSNGTSWVRVYDNTRVYENQAWSWGLNSSGELGDNTTVPKSIPVKVVGGFTDWSKVSAGSQHTIALRSNGTLWAWGRSAYGALGNNSTGFFSSPVSVVGGFTDWCQFCAGMFGITTAIRTNGTLWAWGRGAEGQLGDNTIVSKLSPVSVVGGFSDWCQTSVGRTHAAAVRTNGTLWTWGRNTSGQLGDNTIVNKSSPVSVVGGFTDWCQVSVGNTITAAIRTNGTLWNWGYVVVGGKSSPVSVVGGFTDWCQVSISSRTSAAIRTNGTLWTWGDNNYGQLGNNTGGYSTASTSPVSVVGGFTDWCQVSAGYCHVAAVRSNGTIWTWGGGTCGRLGDNTAINRSSPVSVVGGVSDWCQVSAGGSHTAAIRICTKSGFNTLP